MDYSGQLVQAMKSNQLAHFRRLLETKIDTKDLHWLQYNLLIRAIQLDREEFIHYLLRERNCLVDLNILGDSPLHLALERNNLEVVESLLDSGANVSKRNSNGETAVHMAFNGQVDGRLLDRLLEQSCKQNETNVEDVDGLSLLHIACTRPNVEVVRYFIDRCVDVNKEVSKCCLEYAGSTALHFAAESGNLQVAELLLEKGAKIYLKDANESTPLHLACERRDVPMVDLLLSHDNEREDIVNGYGLTHLMAACMGSDPEIVTKFFYQDQDDPNFYFSDSNNENAQVSNMEMSAFAGFTPLHFAAVCGRTETAEFLIKVGADVYARNNDQIRPARLARTKGFLKTCNAIMNAYRLWEAETVRRKFDEMEMSDGLFMPCEVHKRARD